MQNKNESFVVEIDLYQVRLHIFNGYSVEYISKYLENKFPGSSYQRPLASATAFTMIHKTHGEEYCIDFISPLKQTAISQKTISHEALHTSYEIANCVGLRTDINNQEAIAYILGYIVQKINEKVFEKNRK